MMTAMKLARALMPCLLVALAQNTNAQVLRLDEKPAAAVVQPAPPVQKLTISAAAEPSPALRYRFWVSDVRRGNGDAATNMLRANALMREVPNRQQVENRWSEKWTYAMEQQPIDQFPKDEARQYLENYKQVLSELAAMDDASQVSYELQWKDLRGAEVLTVVFPEIQQARQLSRVLAAQARLAIAEGRYEDAIKSIRIGFRLSEVVSVMGRSFLIGKLVALSICGEMLGEIEVLIQQPGAPNLYWAIASWPSELDSMQSALEGEMLAIEKMFYRVTELPSEELTPAAWQQRVIQTTSDFMRIGGWPATDGLEQQSMAELAAGSAVLLFGDQAKDSLRKRNAPGVESMSYSEALIRDTRDDLFVQLSECFKWALLASEDAAGGMGIEAMLYRDRSRPAALLLGQVLPATNSMRDYHRRFINTRNRLITIEALRAYAASHDNSLPETLPLTADSARNLPAWKSTIDGKPFAYSRTSPTTATLKYESPWPGDTRGHAEITLRK